MRFSYSTEVFGYHALKPGAIKRMTLATPHAMLLQIFPMPTSAVVRKLSFDSESYYGTISKQEHPTKTLLDLLDSKMVLLF